MSCLNDSLVVIGLMSGEHHFFSWFKAVKLPARNPEMDGAAIPDARRLTTSLSKMQMALRRGMPAESSRC